MFSYFKYGGKSEYMKYHNCIWTAEKDYEDCDEQSCLQYRGKFDINMETIFLPVILASNTVVEPFTMMVKIRDTLVTHRAMFAFGATVEQRIHTCN